MAVIYKEVKTDYDTKKVVIPGYYHATYGGLDVIVNKDGLFNLSKICSSYKNIDGKNPKEYCKWAANKVGKRIIKRFRELFISNGGNPRKFLLKIEGENKISGTYGIDKLAIVVALWTYEDYGWQIMEITTQLTVSVAELSRDLQNVEEKYNITTTALQKLSKRNSYPVFAKTGCLYIASIPQKDNIERYKVGITKNLNTRFSSYRTTAPNTTIHFLVYLESTTESRKKLEKTIKDHFMYKLWTMSHEWYEIEYDKLLRFIQVCLDIMPHTIEENLEQYNAFIRELTTGTVGSVMAELPAEIQIKILENDSSDDE